MMLNPQQIQQLLSENESLQTQVKELEEILALREEELELLREEAAGAATLRSQLDLRLEEMAGMQNQISLQQRKTAGAESREMELQQELVDSVQMLQQYNDLKKQFIYTSTQLEDMQGELSALKKKNMMLQGIAVQVGELESKVENLAFERDTLLEKLAALENIQE
ncbi:MAG: hypothetical protein U0V75_02945 [Ferruginibacter sp.]